MKIIEAVTNFVSNLEWQGWSLAVLTFMLIKVPQVFIQAGHVVFEFVSQSLGFLKRWPFVHKTFMQILIFTEEAYDEEVRTLKKKAADGKLTKEELAFALSQVKDSVIRRTLDWLHKQLPEWAGDLIEPLIPGLIEKAVAKHKREKSVNPSKAKAPSVSLITRSN